MSRSRAKRTLRSVQSNGRLALPKGFILNLNRELQDHRSPTSDEREAAENVLARRLQTETN